MFARYLFLRVKDGRKIHQINPSQTLMNLQYTEVTMGTMCICAGSTLWLLWASNSLEPAQMVWYMVSTEDCD